MAKNFFLIRRLAGEGKDRENEDIFIKGLSNEFELIVTKKGDLDDIALKIEILPEEEKNRKPILARLKDQLRLKTNLSCNIEVHPYNSLARYEVIAKPFKDLRKKYE